MEQVIEFFGNLFGAESWPARWVCGIWSPFHGWVYIISDFLIFAAYFVIPIYILRYINFKHKINLPKIFWLFALFILLCGLTHLMDAIIFYWPAYRLSAFIRMLTAVVSWATVFAILKVFPTLIRMKTSDEYEHEIKLRKELETKLLRSNKELEQFAYVTSHDLQAPLKTIRAFSQIIEEEVEGDMNEDVKRSIHEIKSGASQMEEMIEELLKFSRVGSERNIQELDLNSVVMDVTKRLDADLKESKAKINVDVKVDKINGVKIELRQLLQNLIGNAIKFKNPNVDPIVDVRVESFNEGIQISVKDNGIGIDSKHLDKIFNVFQRLHAKSEFTGTGIGLATCMKIAELYHGTIEVKSELGKGTTMIVTLKV